MSLFTRFAALTEPSEALTNPTERIRARALAQLILLIVPVGAIVTVVSALLDPGFFPVFINNSLGLLTLMVAGFVARTKHYRAAAGFSVAAVAYLVLSAGVMREDDIVWWAYGMIVVLVATLLLSLRWAAFVAALMAVAVALVLFYHGKTGVELSAPVGFYVVFAPLLILVAHHRDVVERRRNQEVADLERTLADAQRLETVGRIAGGIAHDFNNLLTVVVSSSGLLRDQPNHTPTAEALLVEIDAAAEQASRLTQQLLAYSRQQVLDRRGVVYELVTDMRDLLHAVLRGEIVIDGEPGAWVMADASQLEKVVMNLAVNTADTYEAIGAGTQRLELELRHDARHVWLRVSDEAGGMPPDVAARAFDPFFTTRAGSSTGLGLSTVHGIVHQSGGDITIETEEGEGTTFVIRLPFAADGAGTLNE